MKTITYEEAYDLYLRSYFDDIMQFDSDYEYCFITELYHRGLIVVGCDVYNEESE